MPDISKVEAVLETAKNDSSKLLGVTIGGHTITPGQYVPKADAQLPPTLTYNAPPGTYIVIGLDIDAPFPSFGILGPILHWIQPGFKPSNGELTTSDPFVANYIGPAPPPLSSPHRYIFLLYEQPADFDSKKYAPADGKPLGNGSRMRYDVHEFEKKAGLGPVLAANYFLSN